MINFINRLALPSILGILIFGVLFYAIEVGKQNLEDPVILSGWALFSIIIILALLNLRKKLIAFNLVIKLLRIIFK